MKNLTQKLISLVIALAVVLGTIVIPKPSQDFTTPDNGNVICNDTNNNKDYDFNNDNNGQPAHPNYDGEECEILR